jgi:hypothetical protein
MTDKLSKLPIKPVLSLVFISGVAVIGLGQLGHDPGGALSLAARTLFWGSAVAYFALRLYQIVMRRKLMRSTGLESDDEKQEK